MRARALILGTLIVGILDITYAISFFWVKAHVPPIRVFHSIAAGLLGRTEARAGGVPTAVLGGVLHFFIAACMVCGYYLAAGQVRALVARPVLFGAIYGFVLYFFMMWVVLPLSAAPTPHLDWSSKGLYLSIVAHTVLVGIPCGVFARSARRA